MKTRAATEREIACQQILEHDSSVFSIQWMTLPSDHVHGIDPPFLFSRYLKYIRRFTLSLIRPQLSADGVEFRLMGMNVVLLRFRGPVNREGAGERSLTLSIDGGLLVQPKQCDRGELAFMVTDTAAGLRVTLQLSGYCPLLLGDQRPALWRKWLYRLTQAYIHKVVTVRFLARIYRELAGPGVKTKVVKVLLREGEEV
ncbi:hypothetical protein [Geobacter argillaceus]|uniref:Uncharacterized protein n=1 Tax=Geobacter argillaceus TaxID=345631 RepID=A0A562WQU1_9BACT|nr:hypothetical protein [Geobacter argillaceus]TWJ32491.1 hypothetical protein JN12_00931 [Geobacter argillaceus]